MSSEDDVVAASFKGAKGNQRLAICLDDPDWRRVLVERVTREKVVVFDSADHPEDDPAPPWTEPAKRGHRQAYIVGGCDAVGKALSDPSLGHAPYAPIGGSGFMLALDATGPGWSSDHSRQREYVKALLATHCEPTLKALSEVAIDHAFATGLVRDSFDLAKLSEQIALRFCGLWFGFAARDHGLLQAAAAAGYLALVHQIVGRHFCADQTTLPLARQAMAQLAQRAGELLTEYATLAVRPRAVSGRLQHRVERSHWPNGVDPLSEWGLSAGDPPLLKWMVLNPGDFSVQELSTIAVGLIVGTVGNVQASLCLVLEALFGKQDRLVGARDLAFKNSSEFDDAVPRWLSATPPVAFLPRRATADTDIAGTRISKGEDVLIWLASAGVEKNCPVRHRLAFADDWAHSCIGRGPALTLVTEALRKIVRLPSLAEELDSVTCMPVGLEQRWGFACLTYPLVHHRSRRLAQQPLNVVMRVKSPTDFHAEAIRRVIAVGAPRIERALRQSRHVHFAWFEFLDNGKLLALHTVYDGNFDAYVQHFAMKVDDLFDRLFEHIEGAPPLPVADHPGAFVDVIRAHNGPAVHGYIFSAYPDKEVPDLSLGARDGRHCADRCTSKSDESSDGVAP